MARWMTILGIWILAAAFGSLGYQLLNYYFYGDWQPLTVEFIWQQVFGPWPVAANRGVDALQAWCGRLPVLGVGVAFAYLCFLLSDSLQPQATLHRPSLDE